MPSVCVQLWFAAVIARILEHVGDDNWRLRLLWYFVSGSSIGEITMKHQLRRLSCLCYNPATPKKKGSLWSLFLCCEMAIIWWHRHWSALIFGPLQLGKAVHGGVTSTVITILVETTRTEPWPVCPLKFARLWNSNLTDICISYSEKKFLGDLSSSAISSFDDIASHEGYHLRMRLWCFVSF